MELIWEGINETFWLIISMDRLVMEIAFRTVWISSLAVGLATLIGLPLGTLLARTAFPGRRLAVLVFRAGMAVPTVFVGVVCYAIFSRLGPLGALELVYTPWVIVVGELLLAMPIIVSISHGAIKALDPRVSQVALTLGASPMRRWRTYISEARVGVTLAILTAFARCVTELGIAMMVGGNIAGRTRTLSTATALKISKGEFGSGLAVGLILLIIALLVTSLIVAMSREEKD